MTRNEAKEILLKIINDPIMSDDEKTERVLNCFYNLEQGHGGRKANQFAMQIEKETGFNMESARLINEVGNIEKGS